MRRTVHTALTSYVLPIEKVGHKLGQKIKFGQCRQGKKMQGKKQKVFSDLLKCLVLEFYKRFFLLFYLLFSFQKKITTIIFADSKFLREVLFSYFM
jgi:hypothetical protein